MTFPRFVAILSALFLLSAALAHAQSDACRRFLMRHDDLRQLYAKGDGMALRVSPVSEQVAGLAAPQVYEVARRKLQAHGLHDPAAPQWLDINVNLDSDHFAILMSLRRWVDDIGYGLPGESAVWGLGGGGIHQGSAGKVLTQLVWHMNEFIALYERAQRACTM